MPDIYYEPVRDQRQFSANRKYSEIDLSNFHDVLCCFEERIRIWYLDPAKLLRTLPDGGHYGFPIVAFSCLIIDTLAQFEAGVFESKGDHFKAFIAARMPAYSGNLPAVINRPTDGHPPHTLRTLDEVLWCGYRCGILHEAHVPLYGAIAGSPGGCDFKPNGYTTYTAGGDCLTVVIQPDRLLEATEKAFLTYLADLRDPVKVQLRRHFKKKFARSFGMEITI